MPFTPKHLCTLPPILIGGRHIKRYHVNLTDAPIEPEIEQAAYAFLPSLLPEPDGTPPATFVVLHRGVQSSYFLAYSWVWDNVLHLGVAAAGQPVLDCPDDDATHFVRVAKPWIGCVWELPALTHEPAAWVRHMLAPEKPDLDAYLADTLPDGPTHSWPIVASVQAN